MQTTLLAIVLLAAQPELPAAAAKAHAAADAAEVEIISGDEVELPPDGGHGWPLVIHKHNPNRTLGMVRYVERGGYLYARPYDYRTLLDYPWHHRKPLRPPYPCAVSMPYEIIPAPLPSGIEDVPPPDAATRRYPDVEAAPLDAPRGARKEPASEARLRHFKAPLGRPGNHLVR